MNARPSLLRAQARAAVGLAGGVPLVELVAQAAGRRPQAGCYVLSARPRPTPSQTLSRNPSIRHRQRAAALEGHPPIGPVDSMPQLRVAAHHSTTQLATPCRPFPSCRGHPSFASEHRGCPIAWLHGPRRHLIRLSHGDQRLLQARIRLAHPAASRQAAIARQFSQF